MSSEQVAGRLGDPKVRIVDCRFSFDAEARTEYLKAHLPGAVHIDWSRDIAAPPPPSGHPLYMLQEPADFARRIDLMSPNPPVESPGAIESIDRSLERLDQLFLWGHWDEPKYRAERERLEAMRKELQDAEEPQRIEPKLTGLVSAWDTGDAVVRRELLSTLFRTSTSATAVYLATRLVPRGEPKSLVYSKPFRRKCLSWWAVMDSNQRPPRCKRGALAN